MATWTLNEAIALSVDLDPCLMKATNLQPLINKAIIVKIGPLMQLTKRALNAYQLHEPVRPANYLKWVKQHEIEFPQPLEERLLRLEERKNGKIKTITDPIEKPLGTRERETLLKIIIGMATDKYKYDPKAEKCGGVTRIKDAIEKAGLKISDDTIRDKLREAEQFLSPEYLEDA